jgi:hypothetical protein
MFFECAEFLPDRKFIDKGFMMFELFNIDINPEFTTIAVFIIASVFLSQAFRGNSSFIGAIFSFYFIIFPIVAAMLGVMALGAGVMAAFLGVFDAAYLPFTLLYSYAGCLIAIHYFTKWKVLNCFGGV